jgi:hypothetical protein
MAEILPTYKPKVINEVDAEPRADLQRRGCDIAAFMVATGYTLAPLPASYANEIWYVEPVTASPRAT